MTNPQLKNISLLIIKAKTAFEAAELLCTHQHWSAAINRCYYALFHSSKAALMLNRQQVKKHTKVKKRFIQDYIDTKIFDDSLAQTLELAEQLRNASDYMDHFQAEEIEVETLREGVQNFLQVVHPYLLSKMQTNKG